MIGSKDIVLFHREWRQPQWHDRELSICRAESPSPTLDQILRRVEQ